MSIVSNTIKPLGNRLVRLLVIGLIFTTILFSSAISAFAANNSQPTDGEASLSGIRDKSEEVAQRDQPAGLDSNKVQTTDGLNMVQGSADQQKMKNQQNSEGTTVKEQIDEGLKNLFN